MGGEEALVLARGSSLVASRTDDLKKGHGEQEELSRRRCKDGDLWQEPLSSIRLSESSEDGYAV
jgi:hypothetical protein